MRALILCITLMVVSVMSASASEVLILQSQRTDPYSGALRGFRTVFEEGGRTVVLSDYAEIDVARLVHEERPRVVLAMGDRALAAARKVHEVPVVAILSLELTYRVSTAENIGGIGMVAPPEQYLKVFNSLGARRIAVVYDPAKSGRYVRRAVHESKEVGLTLVTEQVTSPREIQAKLEKVNGSVDALWLLPDSTVITSINMEAFLLYSMHHNVPIVTYSREQLKVGATAAVDIDFFDLGQQAAEMVQSILKGEGGRRVPVVDPRRTSLHVNDGILRKAGKRLSAGR